MAAKHGLAMVSDACNHALGGSYRGRKVGTLADLNTFSFHPVKPITTGEGGMITTDNVDLAQQMRIFRTHGITTDHHYRQTHGEWAYEMQTLGFNYRLSDFACALGLSQLGKLEGWVQRRNKLADHYRKSLRELPQFVPLDVLPEADARVSPLCRPLPEQVNWGWTRDAVFTARRPKESASMCTTFPVYLHPFYHQAIWHSARASPQR